MATVHVVEQGEYLSSIAAQYGFTDYTILWNDPNNAGLKQSRVNPNVLYPGDQVYIPDVQGKQDSGATARRHIYKLKQSTLHLRLVLEDAYERPLANAACTLYLDDQKLSVATDESGKLEQEIPPGTQTCSLAIGTDETAYDGETLVISVGSLDPIDTLSGQAGRLNNLGYHAGCPAAADDAQFTSAVEEFQCENHLSVDGKPGPQTQAKLKEAHGC